MEGILNDVKKVQLLNSKIDLWNVPLENAWLKCKITLVFFKKWYYQFLVILLLVTKTGNKWIFELFLESKMNETCGVLTPNAKSKSGLWRVIPCLSQLFRGDMLADPQQRSFSSCSSEISICLHFSNDSCSTNLGFLKFFS